MFVEVVSHLSIRAGRMCYELRAELLLVVSTSSQSSSFASLSSSHEHTRRTASQTMRAWRVVSGGVLVVG